MSYLSDHMSQRRLASDAGPGLAAMTMADLGRGDRARVVGYGNDVAASTARRLVDLGIVPGVEVVMVRRAPLHDPVIFRVADYEIALRRAESRAIHVELVT
jgi:ferrous iron transport protein A